MNKNIFEKILLRDLTQIGNSGRNTIYSAVEVETGNQVKISIGNLKNAFEKCKDQMKQNKNFLYIMGHIDRSSDYLFIWNVRKTKANSFKEDYPEYYL